jgi:hypothetical protein
MTPIDEPEEDGAVVWGSNVSARHQFGVTTEKEGG